MNGTRTNQPETQTKGEAMKNKEYHLDRLEKATFEIWIYRENLKCIDGSLAISLAKATQLLLSQRYNSKLYRAGVDELEHIETRVFGKVRG